MYCARYAALVRFFLRPTSSLGTFYLLADHRKRTAGIVMLTKGQSALKFASSDSGYLFPIVREKLKRCGIRARLPVNRHSLTTFEAVLQGGGCVEKSGSPKYRTIQGRHLRTTSAYLGVDARWRVEAPRQEQSGRKPPWSCGYIFATFSVRDLIPLLSYSGLHKV